MTLKSFVVSALTAFIYMSAGTYVGYRFGYIKGYEQAYVDQSNAIVSGIHNIYNKFHK